MPVCADPMPHGVEDEADDRRPVGGKRIAGAGIVDQAAGIVLRVAIVERVVEAAERQRRPVDVAFAGMVEDGVEDDVDAGG